MERAFFDNKVIISIHPEHVANIISGKKTAEIRKGRCPSLRKGDMLFIYETKPTYALTAYAEIAEIQTGWTNDLWDRLKRGGSNPCITRVQFDKYTGQNIQADTHDLYASAIILRNASPLKYHFALTDLKAQGINPPQRWARLTPQQQIGIENLIEIYDAKR